MRDTLLLSVLVWMLFSCSAPEKRYKLPYLGNPTVKGRDTIYPVISSFSFISQDSTTVTEKTFAGKIYVADFIFLSCPTICPVMNKQMQKVYRIYQRNSKVLFLSHTIDPENDSIPQLMTYSKAIGAKSDKWFFVTGKRSVIHQLAEKSYFSAAFADSTAPGGFVHSGALLLIDEDRHIRGVYDGTNEKETERLIEDIGILLEEDD